MGHTNRTAPGRRGWRSCWDRCWNRRAQRRFGRRTTAAPARELADAATRQLHAHMRLDSAGTATPTTASRRAGHVWEHAAAEVAAATAREMLTQSSNVHTTTHMDVEPLRVPVTAPRAAAEVAATPTTASRRAGRGWEHAAAEVAAATAREMLTQSSSVHTTMHMDVEPLKVPVTAQRAAAEVAAAAASSTPRSHVSHTTTHMDVEPFMVPVTAEPAARTANTQKKNPRAGVGGAQGPAHSGCSTSGKCAPTCRRRRRRRTGGGRRRRAQAVDAGADAGCTAARLRPTREGAGGAAARARMLCVQRAGGNNGGGVLAFGFTWRATSTASDFDANVHVAAMKRLCRRLHRCTTVLPVHLQGPAGGLFVAPWLPQRY